MIQCDNCKSQLVVDKRFINCEEVFAIGFTNWYKTESNKWQCGACKTTRVALCIYEVRDFKGLGG
jgi:hypothetical protein